MGNPVYICVCVEDITRWLDDMNFIIIKIIKSISSSHYYYIYSMQKAVNDVIHIFTAEDTENVTGYFLVKHSHISYQVITY